MHTNSEEISAPLAEPPVIYDEFIQLNKHKKECILIHVTNKSSGPIRISSHFNFIEANKMLEFDRSMAFGMRLNIPSGDFIQFEPNANKVVPLVPIAGLQIVRGGNNLVDGEINEETLKRTLKKISKRGFGNKQPQAAIELADIEAVNNEFGLSMPDKWTIELPRDIYAKKYGPTVGDRFYLGDLNLIAEIERDFTNYGEELTFGVGKVYYFFY